MLHTLGDAFLAVFIGFAWVGFLVLGVTIVGAIRDSVDRTQRRDLGK
jgi:hypothetical protein